MLRRVLSRVLLAWWFAMTFANPGGAGILGRSKVYATEAECWEKYHAAIVIMASVLSPATVTYGAQGCEPAPEPQPTKPL